MTEVEAPRRLRPSAWRASSFTNVMRPSSPLAPRALRATSMAMRAVVDGDDLRGPAARRGHRERADEAVGVEHALASRELLDARAKSALVEVEARLLADLEREPVGEAALFDHERSDRVPANDSRPRLEPFGLRGRARRSMTIVTPRASGARRRRASSRIFIPNVQSCTAHRVAEPVHDQPGEPVPFGVYEPVSGGVASAGGSADHMPRTAKARSIRARKNAASSCVFRRGRECELGSPIPARKNRVRSGFRADR